MFARIFNRNLWFVLICVAITAWIYVASAPDPMYQGRKKINVWVPWFGDEFKRVSGMCDRYNTLQDDSYINVTAIQLGSQKERIALAGGDPPHLTAGVPNYQMPDYAMRGLLAPMDDYFHASGRREEEYPEGVWDAFTYKDNLYGMAMSLNLRIIAYNKKIFRQVGLDPEDPPSTLAEFDRAVRMCTSFVNDDPRQGIERLGFTHAGTLWDFGIAFGADFWDPETHQVKVDSATVVRCLEWMKEEVDRYGFDNALAFISSFAVGQTQLSSNDPFIAGKLAMEITGEWKSWVIDLYAPEDFEWGAFAIPAPSTPGAREHSTTLSGALFVIPAEAKFKGESWEFLDWLLQVERMREINDLNPIWKSDYKEEYRTPYWDFVRSFYYGNEHTMAPPDMPYYQTLINELNRATEYALSGDKTPRQALEEAQAYMQKKIDDYYRE